MGWVKLKSNAFVYGNLSLVGGVDVICDQFELGISQEKLGSP